MSSKVRSWPAINEDTDYFWAGVRSGELRIQQCSRCATLSHPPKPHCPVCGCFELGYRVSAGLGNVYSYVTFHKPLSAAFVAPYNVSLIQLDEGVRVISQLVGIEPERVTIGLRARVEFQEVEPGLVLPLFRPVGQP